MGSGRSRHGGGDQATSEDGSEDGEACSSEDEKAHGHKAQDFPWFACCAAKQAGSKSSSSNFVAADVVKGSTRRKVLVANNVGRAVQDYFDIQQNSLLGEGGFATVCQGRSKRTGLVRAIKTMAKARVKTDNGRLRREVDAMMRLDHPNIIKLFQTFEDSECLYLVLEICHGGELFDRIIEEGQLSEPTVATVMRQIFRAVRYMHEAGVCHRDLKPENFLFLTKDPIIHNTLKVIDLGICALYDPPHGSFTTKTGTPHYVAPEVISNWFHYGPECDLWSCGVIMYVMLSGSLPFRGRDDVDTLQRVKTAILTFKGKKWAEVSTEAKELVGGLLNRVPSKRVTAEEALSNQWVEGVSVHPNAAPLLASHIEALRAYRSENRLKKVALAVIARNCDEDKIEQLRSVFNHLDANGDGCLTTAELRDGLMSSGIFTDGDSSPTCLLEIMQSVDADGSGEIDYTEFLAATLEHQVFVQESVCWAAFRVFDSDDDGKISYEELTSVLQDQHVMRSVGKEQVDELMKEVDLNGDGFIDFQEFMAMMKKR